MRLRHNFKSRIAAAMAAVMVFSMAAPALPVYAATATITFDTGDGPGVTYGGYTSNSVSGETGTLLRDVPGFAGIPLVHPDGTPAAAGDSDARPAFPNFTGVSYPGYNFGGWYDASDPLKYVEPALPFAMPSDSKTYAPKWIPSGVAQNFDYTVMHYRMLDGSNTELPATDSGTFYQANYIAFNPNGNPWVSPTQKAMGDTVTAVPLALTAVPGYKVGSVIVKNNKKRKFGEASGAGTGAVQADVGSGNVVSGVMPNDDLTIRYLYIVDTNKTFNLRTEYVDQTGTTIKAPTTEPKNAEQAVSATPPTIAGFVYDSVQVVSGDTDNANASVYGTNTLATHNKFQFDSNGVLTGVMPNQNVKIKYTYRRDPAYQIRVQVKYLDNHGNKLDGQDGRPNLPDIDEPRAVGATGAQTVPVPFLPGYLYAPNMNPGTNNGAVGPSGMVQGTDENLHFTLQAGTDGQGALITITYVENLNDATTWARVSYTSTANGDITGNTAPRSIRVGSYTWQELVGLDSHGNLAISADPIPNYKLEGWYVTINGGAEQKIYDADTNSSTIPTADHKLAIPAGTTTPTAVSVYPKFVEDPNKWYTINFAHSANGSLTGNTTVRVGEKTRDTATGMWNPTTWADVPKPTPVPVNSNYMAQPWTSSSGSQPMNSTVINGSETYTTVFTRIGLADDGVFAMPNANGEVANNGTGTVKVNGANSLRNYAITDMNGNVIATLPGSALQSGAFTGLPVNAQYQVYELPTTENPAAGTPITNVVAANRSQPTVVNVPAVGANATVGTDAANAGQKTITVSPTAPNTEYSLIDASGNVVPASGWVTPSTPGAAIVFDNLDPNTTYTVVARPIGGSQTPQDQIPQGTVIPVTGTPAAATTEYTLKLENGGKVVEIKRMINGTEQIIPIGADDTNVTFREGDKIKFDADVPAGTTFKRWNVLLGSLSGLTTTGQRIVMPAGSVTVSASYNGQSILPAQPKADLDYTPKDGRFALDPADNVRLLTELIDNPDDTAALANPSVDTITYIAKFNRGTVASNYANELKTQVGDNEIKLPWSLQVGLARDVDGVNKLVPATNSNATMRVIARLDDSIKNNTDYELWKRNVDPMTGNISYLPVTTSPADLSAAGFDGNFSFEAKNGDYLVLSYKKAHTVTVIDAMRGTPYTFRIAHGSDLASHPDYTTMRGALALNYTDPTTGIEYEFDQFRKANSQTAPTFADSDAVTRDMTLYAMFIPADDTAWQNARNNLIGEINRGNAVMTDPRIIPHLTPTELSDLTNAVTQANALANRLPRPTTAELVTEHANLKALIDGILARIAGIAPAPTPGGGGGGSHGGGGGSHSGGGGGGGGSRGRGGSSRGVTGSTTPSGTGNRVYQNGAEGNWVNFDPAGHGWYFELGYGKKLMNTWADVAYTFDGQTKIYSYHFDENGVMDSGWWKNDQGVWYHLSTIHDGWFGSMDKGWYHDSADGRWYYLNLLTGAMLTGWQEIDGVWYYLNPVTPAPTWDWDATQNRWVYGNRGGRPYGSMYANEVTPDGYHVDASGAWIRETP